MDLERKRIFKFFFGFRRLRSIGKEELSWVLVSGGGVGFSRFLFSVVGDVFFFKVKFV